MRILSTCLFVLAAGSSVAAQEIISEYTQLDTGKHCSVVAAAGENNGDWRHLVCAGYRGYPVFVFSADLRYTVFYGFPPDGDLAPASESFNGFNRIGPTIEWRIERDGVRERPFATIHRWFVQGDPESEKPIEVLVVEKVGQLHGRDGCAVGYVVATGNADANDEARRIADEQARRFICGDQPIVVTGSVPVPSFNRTEN